MKRIYAVYKCDDNKRFSSMNASAPLVITTSKRRAFLTLLHNLADDEFRKANEIIHSKLLVSTQIYELNNICKNYWIASFID